jgi:hypothetical protein
MKWSGGGNGGGPSGGPSGGQGMILDKLLYSFFQFFFFI